MPRLLCCLLLVLSGCKTIPITPPATLAELAVTPDAYLSGRPVALSEPVVLNREDFVYDAKLSPDSQMAAVSRLGSKSFHLALHDVTKPPQLRADVAINALEYDVDAVEFSPDGTRVATVSRDGSLRIYSAKTGTLETAWLTEEPLVTVGWHPSGTLVALGSAHGLVTLVSIPQMQHVAEIRAHHDEVRGLAFTPSGELVTGGWDKQLLIYSLADAPSPVREVRTHVTKKGGLLLFRAVIDKAVSVPVALDERMPLLVVRGSVAQAAGVEVSSLRDTVQIPTAFGQQLAKVVKGRSLSIKNLTLEPIDFAICDACVPPDAQAVLGSALLQHFSTAFDAASEEIVIAMKEGAPQFQLSSAQTLKLERAFQLPAPINDLSLDALGHMVGIAFSETKAERTKVVYDREKQKTVEPAREWDCAARVDIRSGTVVEKKGGHAGVVASVAISPDGLTLASGGWDKKVILHGMTDEVMHDYGWAIRRVRFSRDARRLIVAAWTPQNPLSTHQSDPSAVVYEVVYSQAEVMNRK